MFRLDILDADWSETSRRIVFRPMPPVCGTYIVRASRETGMEMSDSIGPFRCVGCADVARVLGPCWTYEKFEIAWQAFAEGMKRQKNLT